jgi:hypothetical protein
VLEPWRCFFDQGLSCGSGDGAKSSVSAKIGLRAVFRHLCPDSGRRSQLLRVGGLARQRGHDKARIFAFGKVFRLGDDPTLARPAVERLVAQLLEEAFGFAAVLGFGFNLGQFTCDQGFKPWIAGKAEDVVDAVKRGGILQQLFFRVAGLPFPPLSR